MVFVTKWDEASRGPLSEAAIRAAHVPSNRHRVSPYNYFAGEVRHGIFGRAETFYILEGKCRLEFPELTVELEQGDVAELPAGTHSLKVLGEGDLKAVRVWHLPFEVP